MSLINIAIGIVSTGVTSGLNAIRNQFRSFRGAINSEFAQFVGWGAVFAGVVGGFKKAISSASQMQGFKASFATLLGSADAAEKRLQELSQFAATTPFELPELVEASRVLETLTQGSLATGAGLRMVGDMASLTGEPVKELAVHVGRLYSGMMSGRAVGESMARLQELGLLSDKTRTQLENLQKEGKKGPEVWKIAADSFGAFAGEMERKSQTWEGKMSNLQDNVNALFREFGQPIIDTLGPFLEQLVSTSQDGTSAFRAMGEAVSWVINSIRTLGAVGGAIIGIISEEIGLAVENFRLIGGAIAESWEALKDGDITGVRQAFRAADAEFAKFHRQTRSNQKLITQALEAEYDKIWAKPVKPNVQTNTPKAINTVEVEDGVKRRKLADDIAKMQQEHAIDQLEGEAKINALIAQRADILRRANDETAEGLEATKEALKLQQEIDKEKDAYAKRVLTAQQKETDAQEKLSLSRMTSEEKVTYLKQKAEDLRVGAFEEDIKGNTIKAAEMRAEALDLQQQIESEKPKLEVKADSLARIGGGGRSYMSGAEDLAKRTAKAGEDTVSELKLVRKELEKVNRNSGQARWAP
jgi:hypothetical protein